MFRLLLIVGCVSAFLSSDAMATVNEGQVRQAGDDRTISLSASRGGQFTVQGTLYGDVVIVRLGNGNIFAASSINDLIYSPFCTEWYQASNGEFVVRLFFNAQPAFDNGTVSIFRGATELDTDRIRVLR